MAKCAASEHTPRFLRWSLKTALTTLDASTCWHSSPEMWLLDNAFASGALLTKCIKESWRLLEIDAHWNLPGFIDLGVWLLMYGSFLSATRTLQKSTIGSSMSTCDWALSLCNSPVFHSAGTVNPMGKLSNCRQLLRSHTFVTYICVTWWRSHSHFTSISWPSSGPSGH